MGSVRGVGVALVLAGALTVIHSEPSAGGPSAANDLAARTNPLSASMRVDCLGVPVPVALLAAPGGAERGTSPASAALRHFLAHNPFAGMGSVSTRNWLLLARTTRTLTFGQRKGRIGVGSVVTLSKRGSSFVATGEGGCGPVVLGQGRSGEPIGAAVRGSDLVLSWENGSNCGTGPAKAARTVERVLLRQTSSTVHVLLVSKPAPDAGASAPGQGCFGVGITSTTRVVLTAPLGHRTVIDDAVVPGATVPVDR